MKKWIIGLAFIFFMFNASNAQNKQNPEERIKEQTEQMAKDLNLNDTQKEQVAEVNKKFAEKMKAIRMENNGNREAIRSAMKKPIDEREAELKKILTEDQYKKHLEIQAQQREERKNKRQGGTPPNR